MTRPTATNRTALGPVGPPSTRAALLAGVPPADAATFACAIALAVVMTLAGSLLPALRAVRVDPMTVMRAE